MLQESWKFTLSDLVTSYQEIQTKELIGDDDIFTRMFTTALFMTEKKGDLIDLNIQEEGNGLVIAPQ